MAFVLFVVLPLMYVLSYAPVVRVCEGPDPEDTTTFVENPPGRYPLYKPVNLLIDHTPFREPLLSWAEVWNVRARFEIAKWWYRDFSDGW